TDGSFVRASPMPLRIGAKDGSAHLFHITAELPFSDLTLVFIEGNFTSGTRQAGIGGELALGIFIAGAHVHEFSLGVVFGFAHVTLVGVTRWIEIFGNVTVQISRGVELTDPAMFAGLVVGRSAVRVEPSLFFARALGGKLP